MADPQRSETTKGEFALSCDDGSRPHRAGDQYCSPRCGFGCMWAAYERAVAEGEALAKRLGIGWELCVWENCGWNYSATNGEHEVHVTRLGDCVRDTWKVVGYWASVNASTQAIGEAPIPELALEAALATVRDRVAADTAALRRLGDFGHNHLAGGMNATMLIEAAP